MKYKVGDIVLIRGKITNTSSGESYQVTVGGTSLKWVFATSVEGLAPIPLKAGDPVRFIHNKAYKGTLIAIHGEQGWFHPDEIQNSVDELTQLSRLELVP